MRVVHSGSITWPSLTTSHDSQLCLEHRNKRARVYPRNQMQKAARRIVERLRLHGYEAFFAGGWVRDYLLGRPRSRDVDIATSAPPDSVLQLFPGAIPIGRQFGVAQVRMYGRPYEVATFRREGPYLDGRHPSEVEFCGSEEDARRRDFTINGMLFDPVSEQVIDYVDGRADLGRKLLRTIGNARDRFEEDRLRMMRAVRFACDLGFEIESRTWEAIKRLSFCIIDVSAERIRDELLKILTGPAPDRGLDLLQESGLLRAILPEVEAMRGVEQPPEFHPEGDVFVHTRLALGLLRKPSGILAMGTLLHDIGKPPTFAVKERIRFDGHVEVGMKIAAEICRRLHMSNQETEQVVALVQHHLRFMHVLEMRKSTLIRFLRMPNYEDHLELHRVDCLSSHRDLTYYRFCARALKELRNSPEPLPSLISGDDLIDMGYPPGPRFREILHAVEDLQIEKQLHTPEEAREYVRRAFPL